jgi:hypothetical protein
MKNKGEDTMSLSHQDIEALGKIVSNFQAKQEAQLDKSQQALAEIVGELKVIGGKVQPQPQVKPVASAKAVDVFRGIAELLRV